MNNVINDNNCNQFNIHQNYVYDKKDDEKYTTACPKCGQLIFCNLPFETMICKNCHITFNYKTLTIKPTNPLYFKWLL